MSKAKRKQTRDERRPQKQERRRVARVMDFGGAQLMRRPAVEDATGLPPSTIYWLMSEGKFPRPVEITPGRVAWVASEISAWIAERIAARVAA